MSSYQYKHPHVKDDRLIFHMGIPIPGKDGLYIEMGPWYTCLQHEWRTNEGNTMTLARRLSKNIGKILKLYSKINCLLTMWKCVNENILNVYGGSSLTWQDYVWVIKCKITRTLRVIRKAKNLPWNICFSYLNMSNSFFRKSYMFVREAY